jgi:hypothetical protein
MDTHGRQWLVMHLLESGKDLLENGKGLAELR